MSSRAKAAIIHGLSVIVFFVLLAAAGLHARAAARAPEGEAEAEIRRLEGLLADRDRQIVTLKRVVESLNSQIDRERRYSSPGRDIYR